MRVAVLGAGYGGLAVARELEERLPPDDEILVIEETGRHLIRHEVHRVIRRPDVAAELEVPLSDVLSRATVRAERVSEIDRSDRRIELAAGESIEYDYAAVCLGADTAFYGYEGIETHGIPLRDVEDARRIRATVLDIFEDGGRLVVGGAGLSGIQVAGEVAALARQEDAADAVEVVLLEQADAVAPGFDPAFQAAIADELGARDIDVRTGVTVEGASGDELRTTEGSISFDGLVWTGGITGTDALGGERPSVRGDLRLDERAFAVGDAARVVDREGELVPASAQAAIAEGKTAAANIATLRSHDASSNGFEPRLETLSFSPTAWVVSVGDGAVASVGPSVVRGQAAAALKKSVGVGHRSSIGATERAIEHVRKAFAP